MLNAYVLFQYYEEVALVQFSPHRQLFNRVVHHIRNDVAFYATWIAAVNNDMSAHQARIYANLDHPHSLTERLDRQAEEKDFWVWDVGGVAETANHQNVPTLSTIRGTEASVLQAYRYLHECHTITHIHKYKKQ